MCLYKQNERVRTAYKDAESMLKEATVRGVRNVRGNKDLKDVILEVSPKLRNILQARCTNIGRQRGEVRDHISILQCYKCYEFGHNSTTCEDTQKCGNCSGDFKGCTKKVHYVQMI